MTDDLLATRKTWLSANDLAREFGLPRSTVYTLAAEGAFGVPLRLSAKKGAGLRFHRADVIKEIIRRREQMAEDLGL